jgi:hypothetical protein
MSSEAELVALVFGDEVLASERGGRFRLAPDIR